jgi:23S rRNA U2552 (ribose-2'-O)-methylase RlmE/FtsJ
MSEPITRPEFNETVGRIHDKIDAIAKTGIQIETSAKMVEKSVEKICECVYGNSKEGITQKLTRLFERVSLHTKLIMGIVFSILGIAFYVIRNSLLK